MPQPLGPEQRLLMVSARAQLDASAAATIARLIAGGVDRTRLIELALHHRITPALLPALTIPAAAPLVPADIVDALQQYCDAARRRNQYLATELGVLLSAFADAGAAALPFKGVVLGDAVRSPRRTSSTSCALDWAQGSSSILQRWRRVVLTRIAPRGDASAVRAS